MMAAIEQRWRTGEKLRFSGGRCNRTSGGEPPFEAPLEDRGKQGKPHATDLETGAKMDLCGACGLV